MNNPQHSMESSEHYTPAYIIELARLVLGTIDYDPCSSMVANIIVNAKTYTTKDYDGLTESWSTVPGVPNTVWCNPPGSRHIRPSLPMQFWVKLQIQIASKNVSHALFLAYSLEQLQQSQSSEYLSMLRFPICVPRKRIAFIDQHGVMQTNPTHGNAIIYVPGTIDKTDLFKKTFSNLGYVKI